MPGPFARPVQPGETLPAGGAAAVIPIRAQPTEPDSADPQRIALVVDRWKGQDGVYTAYGRVVEEHVRMLSNKQWDVWVPELGRFVDTTRYMSEDERRWRQRPAMDYLRYWFQLTLAKATENPPLVTFQPASADRADALLAEVMDPIFKTLWDETEMGARVRRAVAWALVAGETYFLTRPAFEDAEEKPLVGPAVLSMAGPDGQDIQRVVEHAPYDSNGNVQAQLVAPGEDQDPDDYGYDVTGEAAQTPGSGTLAVDVACPLEIRAEWGVPTWREKRWIIHRWFLSPVEVTRRYGVTVPVDTRPADDGSGVGYLERLLFGGGYFGQGQATPAGGSDQGAAQGYVCGYTMWERPCPDYPEGRLLVVTSTQVLHDSARPAKFEAAGPIRRVQFLEIPGRPFASTPLEVLVPLQKRLNRIEAQVAEHTNLCTNPLLFYIPEAVEEGHLSAKPGSKVPVLPGHDVRASAMWLAPPSLAGDVWRHKADVKEQMFIIGGMTGNEGTPPTDGASGELVQQLRYNTDRPLTPLTLSLVDAIADVAEDWLALLPLVWSEEQLLTVVGDDAVVRTVTVEPHMFEGSVNVRPIVESAAPESRENRQQRVTALFQQGVFGDPLSPDARSQYLSLMRFPELTRASRPGGVDRVTAEQALGKIVRGEVPATGIALLPTYRYDVWEAVVRDFTASPEFLSLDAPIQQEALGLWELVRQAGQAQQAAEVQRAAQSAAVQTIAQGQLAHLTQATHPAPPTDENDDPSSPGPDKAKQKAQQSTPADRSREGGSTSAPRAA